jgi:hypothetical protein
MEKKLNPIFESMDIPLETKTSLQEAFDKAVLSEVTEKMDEYVDKKLTEEKTRLEEEFKEHKEYLTEALDGYLDTVVEEFIEENKPEYERQIDEAKASTLLELFDNIVKIVGVDMMTIAESKEELDQDEYKTLTEAKETLEEEVSNMADKLIESKREADKYLKTGLIAEMAQDLSILESEKFEKLADMVEFSRNPEYVQKLETIRESIIDSRSSDFVLDNKDTKLPGTAFKQPETPTIEDALDFSRYV